MRAFGDAKSADGAPLFETSVTPGFPATPEYLVDQQAGLTPQKYYLTLESIEQGKLTERNGDETCHW
jgi:hypothetical protein